MSLKRIHLVLNLYPAMARKILKLGSQTKLSGTEPIGDETYRDKTYRDKTYRDKTYRVKT